MNIHMSVRNKTIVLNFTTQKCYFLMMILGFVVQRAGTVAQQADA